MTTVENTQIPKTKFRNKLRIPLYICGGPHIYPLIINTIHLPKPTIMDFEWFLETARQINKIPCDWDWERFKLNILLPNKEHIKQVNNFNNYKLNILLEDGYVFMNNCDKTWENSGNANAIKLYNEEKIASYPNLKNLWDKNIYSYGYRIIDWETECSFHHYPDLTDRYKILYSEKV